MFQQHQDESLYDAWTRFKDLLRKVPYHRLNLWLQVKIIYDHVDYATQMAIDYAADERLRKLRPEEAWETIKDLAQYKEEEWNGPIFYEIGSPDYIDATLEQELESMECHVESLMRSEVLLDYEVRFMFLERPYKEEFKRQILNLMDHQEDQIRQLEEDMRKTKDTFMCLADSLIATLQENKLEYKDEDEVEIKMMGTRMDTESISIAFGRNTHDLGSIGKETDKTTNLHQSLLKKSGHCLETVSQILAIASEYARDGVRIPTTALERSRPKETLEDSASQNKEDYSTCVRSIRFLRVRDYALWDVIENGNSFKPVAQTITNADGISTILIPGLVTTKEKVQKNNDVNARKSLGSIFNKLQKIVSQLAILGENISQEDLNLKFLRSLPSEWNTHVVVWRNKPDLDTMSFS
ncbi:hypothetical protein Tco_0222796 [Tanacetum coccineum]